MAMVSYRLEPPWRYGLSRIQPKSPLSSKYTFAAMDSGNKKRQTLKEVCLQHTYDTYHSLLRIYLP